MPAKVVNVQPRYARLRSRESGEIYGWENIELISDRSFETWIEEFKQVKDKYPGGHSHRLDHGGIQPRRVARDRRALPGGRRAMRSSSTCPARTGLPERKMGAAMGENPDILSRGLRLGDGGRQEAGVGQDDAERHAHRRSHASVAARRLRRHRRDQHDSQRARRRSGYACDRSRPSKVTPRPAAIRARP